MSNEVFAIKNQLNIERVTFANISRDTQIHTNALLKYLTHEMLSMVTISNFA